MVYTYIHHNAPIAGGRNQCVNATSAAMGTMQTVQQCEQRNSCSNANNATTANKRWFPKHIQGQRADETSYCICASGWFQWSVCEEHLFR